jgi:hypothetical protein
MPIKPHQWNIIPSLTSSVVASRGVLRPPSKCKQHFIGPGMGQHRGSLVCAFFPVALRLSFIQRKESSFRSVAYSQLKSDSLVHVTEFCDRTT